MKKHIHNKQLNLQILNKKIETLQEEINELKFDKGTTCNLKELNFMDKSIYFLREILRLYSFICLISARAVIYLFSNFEAETIKESR